MASKGEARGLGCGVLILILVIFGIIGQWTRTGTDDASIPPAAAPAATVTAPTTVPPMATVKLGQRIPIGSEPAEWVTVLAVDRAYEATDPRLIAWPTLRPDRARVAIKVSYEAPADGVRINPIAEWRLSESAGLGWIMGAEQRKPSIVPETDADMRLGPNEVRTGWISFYVPAFAVGSSLGLEFKSAVVRRSLDDPFVSFFLILDP